MGNLTAVKVKALLEQPGRHSDGQGLLLFVRSPGQASWVCRAQHNGKRRDYGLGSAKLFSLSEARERAWQVRKALADGRDPRTLWDQDPKLTQTFREAVTDFLKHRGEKVGEKRNKQSGSQLTSYARPSLGRLQVQSITAEHIAECLRPIWTSKPEVARQVRSLIVRTLSYARPDAGDFETALSKAIGMRLPNQPAKGRFDALPYEQVPALMDRLAAKTGVSALALRLLILCANRSGEIRGATWDEIDLERGVWTIPAERMKMRKPHRVPLSSEAKAVLKRAAEIRRAGSDQVFPNRKGEALSDMALTKTLRDMGMDCTAHGMRSSFRDWAAEQTSVAGEIAEAALAHAVPSAVEAAYKRTDFFERRRELMIAWAKYATGGEGGKVVQLKVEQY
jgi:integrase